jgi:P-type Ca2+ transporter type 2C
MMRRTVPLSRLGDLFGDERGLTGAEVAARRQLYGPNDIIEAVGRPWLELARDTARDPMIWFLVGTSALYGVLGERIEALTLILAILPLVGMDTYLHRRTRASTEGLSSRLAARASVLRDGVAVVVAATDLVPGDLVTVPPGEPFPADGLIVAGSGVQADESMLTGEAYPVAKRPLSSVPVDGAEPAVDGLHWGFAGTRVLTGDARLRVVFTGAETVYGEIVRSAASGAHARTPLQAAIASLVSALLVAAAVMCLLLAFVRLRQGYGWVDALVSAATLAIAALPEEFPIVFTFFLGVGVYRLAKRQALVRRAVSVENIGRVTCICADKTGTITEGRLHLTHLVPVDDLAESALLDLAAVASRHGSQDPLDAAILRAAAAAGRPSPAAEVLETFPFTEDSRRETAVVRNREGAVVAATKGSPEVILPMSTLPEPQRASWSRRVVDLADDGHRVVACAWRVLDRSGWVAGEPTHSYRFAGLLAFEDPVRQGVAEAITMCRDAGIHVVMVTGDHPVTARAVAREIGLGGDAPAIVSADEMKALPVADVLRGVDVVARAVPSQKLALVRALQEGGEIVAVTGDGVNDVPALQAADIGIAMGERGTRSAREVAAIVLLDDNFRTIVRAISEGRQLFRNLQLSFAYLLMVHIPLVVTAALIPLAGYPVLYLPIHIVWLELIIHPTALLVFQDLPPSGRLLHVEARHRQTRFFARRDWGVIAAVGALITVLILAGYLSSVSERGAVEHARAMAVAGLTFASAALTAALSRLRTWIARLVAGGTVALSLALVQVPALAHLLHMQPLHWDDWGRVLAASALPALLALLFPPRD